MTAPRDTARTVIPDIDIGRVYNDAFPDADIHYGTFGGMADMFGRDTAAHRHDRFYQLHFIHAGRLELRLDDVAYAEDGPLFFFTPPSVPHAFRTDPSVGGHVITVAQHVVWRLFDDDPTLAREHMTQPRCFALAGADGRRRARELSRLFVLLRREAETTPHGSTAGIEAYTRLILIAVFRMLDSPTSGNAARHHDLMTLRRFHELVERHFAEHWTVPRYASALHMTEARLTDLCNRLAAKSPKQIALERMGLEARRFLTFSRLQIAEIGDALGYVDVAYFCRTFKRQHGVTPSVFRSLRVENQGKVQPLPGKVPSGGEPP